MATVTLQNLTKTFPPDIRAVAGVDLDIRDGEFMVLVGPSGCGKTTVLRLIAGLDPATSGSVRIGDRDVSHMHPKDRDVAMVFQSYALYPHMTVYGNMSFALKLAKIDKAEIDERVRNAAALLDIESLLDRRPDALSGGQQQRVALGRAMVREPACYLFDEPMSNLDAALRLNMRAELKKLHMRLKTTTVYVTHDQEEAMTLADRIAVMKDGVLQQVGPPLEVYQRPVNRFVAGFIGTPPMNFIDGRVEKNGESIVFRADSVNIPLNNTVPDSLTDRDIVLGIRPQAIRVTDTGIASEVTVVEPLGDTVDITMTLPNGASVVARLPAAEHSGIAADTVLYVTIGPDHLHFFNRDDGQTAHSG